MAANLLDPELYSDQEQDPNELAASLAGFTIPATTEQLFSETANIGSPSTNAAAPSLTNDQLNEQSRQDPTFNPRDYIVNRDSAGWESVLRGAGGSMYDPSDLAGVQRWVANAANSGKDPQEAINNQLAIYRARAGNTPNSDGSGGGGGTGTGSGISDGPGSNYNYNRDGGAAATDAQMSDIIAAIKAISGQQNPGINVPDPVVPTINVPGENLSPAIDNTLLTLLEGGYTPELNDQISSTLRTLLDPNTQSDILNQRLQTIREKMASMEQGLSEDIRGELADRGLISMSGIPQGAEFSGMRRMGERLAQQFAPETANAITEESVRADQRVVQALTLATGYSRDRATQMLNAATAAGDRQGMMADIALRSLDQNRQWNQFLAQFNLDRERLLNDIRNGQSQNVLSLVMQFMALTRQSQGGYV